MSSTPPPTRWARAARMLEAEPQATSPLRSTRDTRSSLDQAASLPATPSADLPASPRAMADGLKRARYIADDDFATVAYLAVAMGKPLLLEGAPGVGKTEAAKALSTLLDRELVRLQCYEGIDAAAALYEWNYPRQLLAMRQAQTGDAPDLYSDDYLIERPLLTALRGGDRIVLLIDEIDRSDHEFEAFLLEFLSDFTITIPETGMQRAGTRPIVILTSNRTRELHEALRRRCVYHWIDYPTPEREAQIVQMRAPGVAQKTAQAVVRAVGELRDMPLAKPPGIAEAVDWAEAAHMLGQQGLAWPDAFRQSIGLVLKDEEDLSFTEDKLQSIVNRTTR